VSSGLPEYTVPRNGNGDIRHIVGDFGPRELVTMSKAATPQSRGSLGLGGDIYEELGRSGLRHWGGFVFEEWLRELQQGRRAAEVYREMQDQDPIIGAIMYAITMLMRRVTWWCEPKGSQQAEWLWGVLNDMRTSWPDTITDIISFLGYGYSWQETVYKKRNGENRDSSLNSRFDDGQIALAGLPGRSQDSLWKWVFDDTGQIEGLIQNPPPDYLLRFIPTEKALHFRTTIFKQNPEGRALAADTPVPTPDGWRRMDELKVGDFVYDAEGEPTPVVGVASWDDRPCYEVVLTEGQSIVADANHLWSVTKTHSRERKHLLTTQQMAEHLETHSRPHFSFGMTPRLRGTTTHLPLDPYVLGYWLGDGNARDGRISYGERDLPHLVDQIRLAGFEHTDYGSGYLGVAGLRTVLRGLGLLGNKHVPRMYLQADPDARLALLQGLMDSDGAIGNIGSCMFFNSDRRLIADCEELVRSLGGIPHVQVTTKAGHFAGMLNGRAVVATKPNYRVHFALDRWVFRLERKRERQVLRRSHKSSAHMVSRIEPAPRQRTVCIQVGEPGGLFLAGRAMVPTHNSILRNAYRAFYFTRNLQNLEGIGMERDLAGLPMLHPPPGVDIWDSNDPAMAAMRTLAQNVVSSIRRDEQEGIVLPDGWVLELLTTGGTRQLDISGAISRYENRIATSVLADLVMMGQDKVGSYALAVTKKDLFAASLGAYLDIISSVINTQLVPRLWALNGFTMPQPSLAHGAVETVDLDTLGNYIMRLGQSGAPIDWETVLPWAMNQGGLPEPKEGHDFSPRVVTRPGPDTPASDRLTAK
jgi:hypothetical protein